MVPLLVHHNGLTVQEAVDKVATIIHDTYQAFQALEPRIIELGQTYDIEPQVQAYLESCRDMCIGFFHWSYVQISTTRMIWSLVLIPR